MLIHSFTKNPMVFLTSTGKFIDQDIIYTSLILMTFPALVVAILAKYMSNGTDAKPKE